MVCFHWQFDLGDNHGFSNPEEFEAWREEHADEIAVILPMYLYVRIKTELAPGLLPENARHIGYIYTTKDAVRREYDVRKITKATLQRVTAALRSEIDLYEQYLAGQVYGFVVTNRAGEQLASRWGLYDLEHVRSEAREFAIQEAKRIFAERQAQLEREATSAGDVPDVV